MIKINHLTDSNGHTNFLNFYCALICASNCAKLYFFFSLGVPPCLPSHDCREIWEDIWYIFRKNERERERDGKREAAFPPSLPPPSFSPSVCHSYLWEIRLETVTEKRGGAKSGIRVATHALSAFLITSLILCLPKPRSSASQLQTVFFKFSLYLPFVSSYSSLPLCFLCYLILFHCRSNSRSLSELSVQTVEYMVPKYTSPLSLHLNKLQRGERKREAVGQEERRLGVHRGDEAWKKEIFK